MASATAGRIPLPVLTGKGQHKREVENQRRVDRACLGHPRRPAAENFQLGWKRSRVDGRDKPCDKILWGRPRGFDILWLQTSWNGAIR